MGSAYSQSGPKWATQGNTTSTGDFIGTTDFKPLVFKTNNLIRGAFTETGSFQLNNLIGTGNRFLQTDANGNIIPFTMGTVSQVLYGNGTWGALPASPWQQSGSTIYYNIAFGKVGIGTSTPLFPLDVIGDVRISNNLYVGGGIVITDKVNANAEVVTGKMKADSIVTDSTKGFYGTSKFNGDVKLQSKLSVYGNTTINGSLSANSITSGNISTTNFNVSTLLTANKISAYRIFGMPGDSLVRLGDSTINFDFTRNRMWTTGVTTAGVLYGGLGIGTMAKALGTQSIAIGSATNTLGTQSIAIGAGTSIGSAGIRAICIGAAGAGVASFVNNTPFSLYIGFKSDIPTFVVTPSAGAGTTGNVGISTTIPEDKLQIGNGITKVVMGSAYGVATGYGTSYIGFNASRQQVTGTWSAATDGAHNGGSIIYSNIGGDMLFSTIPNTGATNQTGIPDATINNNVKFLITSNGNVGIGLNNIPDPNYKLTVCGAIHSKRVVVSLGWCDFVFAKDYKLRTLEETEKYILANGYLPEIPSAKNVETNGADLGELVRLQMQKIEELTLYLIEQNKKIELLEKKVYFNK